jgi:hypothetical protein
VAGLYSRLKLKARPLFPGVIKDKLDLIDFVRQFSHEDIKDVLDD